MCIFCQIVAGQAPCSEVYQDEAFMAFMDIYPFRPGHVLVIPKHHVQYVHELTLAQRERWFGVASRIAEAVRASDLPCDDLHFLINDGKAANQTVPHAHLHILPRRRGDLWRALAELVKRPIAPIVGRARRAELDRQAGSIRAHIGSVITAVP